MKETCITISSYSENWFYSRVQGKLAHNTENGYRNLIFKLEAATEKQCIQKQLDAQKQLHPDSFEEGGDCA